jgi:hypothetical protein
MCSDMLDSVTMGADLAAHACSHFRITEKAFGVSAEIPSRLAMVFGAFAQVKRGGTGCAALPGRSHFS